MTQPNTTWESEFAEYKDLPLQQWCVGLVASALLHGKDNPGWERDASHITEALIDKFNWVKIAGYREGIGTKKCTDCTYEGFPGDFEKPIFECAYCRFWFCPEHAEQHFEKEQESLLTSREEAAYQRGLDDNSKNIFYHKEGFEGGKEYGRKEEREKILALAKGIAYGKDLRGRSYVDIEDLITHLEHQI